MWQDNRTFVHLNLYLVNTIFISYWHHVSFTWTRRFLYEIYRSTWYKSHIKPNISSNILGLLSLSNIYKSILCVCELHPLHYNKNRGQTILKEYFLCATSNIFVGNLKKTRGKTLYASILRLKKLLRIWWVLLFLNLIPFEEYISGERSKECLNQHVQIGGK